MAVNHKIAMHFAARDAEAVARAQRRQESPLVAATTKFNNDFLDAKKDILAKLEKSTEVSDSQVPEYFAQLQQQCQELQKLVSSAAGYLSKFDLKQSQKDVSEVQAAIHVRQSRIMPKKRFAFKTRSTKSQDSADVGCTITVCPDTTDESTRSQPIAKPDSVVSASEDSSCHRSDLTDKTFTIEHDDIADRDVSLMRLKNCCARLHGAPATLRLVSLENCTVLVGPVATSVFLEKCKNCALVFACQQMRMHESTSCDVYLHVTSRAIIEDCSGIRVAPYNYLYAQLSEHFQSAGLNRQSNNWESVDDFKWLNTSAPSPNWCILPEAERSHDWRNPPARPAVASSPSTSS